MDRFTRRNADGSVNIVASQSAHTEALNQWVAENEVPVDRISTALNTVLDQNASSSRIPMPALLSLVAHELGTSVQNFKSVSNRIHAFVTSQVKAGRLFVVKGKGGGVTREAPTTSNV